MIEFQIAKVKEIRKLAAHSKIELTDVRMSLIGLCDVVLELLAIEKIRERKEGT